MNIRRVDSWRVFRLANGWGACAFDPAREELLIVQRVDTQGAGDGETIPSSSIADLLLSQEGEAPQAVLGLSERGSEGVQGPASTPEEVEKWQEEA